MIPKISSGFWYVGTPYSRFPGGIEAGFRAACKVTAELLKAGHPVFSPIAHSHPLAIHGDINPTDHAVWLPADAPMMDAAHGLIVAMLPTWRDSYGLAHEIDVFAKAGKPIIYWECEA